MDLYQPKAYRGDLGGGVFVVGKLFEEKIGPFIGEPPTTAQILQGLYALHNETLGGLLPGVGFIHGEHFTTNQCVVPVKLTVWPAAIVPEMTAVPPWSWSPPESDAPEATLSVPPESWVIVIWGLKGRAAQLTAWK